MNVLYACSSTPDLALRQDPREYKACKQCNSWAKCNSAMPLILPPFMKFKETEHAEGRNAQSSKNGYRKGAHAHQFTRP
eukprot:451559-Pelagomonas_calceolata.AAC.3